MKIKLILKKQHYNKLVLKELYLMFYKVKTSIFKGMNKM